MASAAAKVWELGGNGVPCVAEGLFDGCPCINEERLDRVPIIYDERRDGNGHGEQEHERVG